MICDCCGKELYQNDDDTLYCPFCGQEYDDSWVIEYQPELYELSPYDEMCCSVPYEEMDDY